MRRTHSSGLRPPSTTPKAPVAFHVVTGFLGAGKTTLINRLVRSRELSDALVIVNEIGEIGLDHLLYEQLSGDAILIGSGCVCCALRGDLIEAVQDVLFRRDAGALPRFDRIVLETTGVAEPAPILHALIGDPALGSRLSLAGVTTAVDAVNGEETLRRRRESARQIAVADRLVIAKSDLVPASERELRLKDLRAALRALNPIAPILDGAAAEFGPAEFLAKPRLTNPLADERASGAAHGVRTFAFRSMAPIDPSAFARFLSLRATLLGPKLLRLKGLIALADRPETPLLVEGVQHVLHAPRALPGWPEADRSTRLVVIVEAEAGRQVEDLWAALTRAPRTDAPDMAALADNPLAPRVGGLLG